MTEKEAKTKLCCSPLALAGSLLALTGVKLQDKISTTNCVGSACMAFRYHDEPEEVATDRKCEVCKGSGVVVTGSGETAGGEECNACVGGYQTEAVPTGYCGLAGKP